MLEQRVKRSGNRFQVLKESGTEREVYYGLFGLHQNPDEKISLKKIQYWDGANAFEVKLSTETDTCVRVLEKEGDRIVEQYEFYYTPYDAGNELRLSMEKAHKKYGANAYLITIEWIECRSEPINSRHIYLENKEGERFYFLRDTIEAMNPNGKKLQDQYITRLPMNQSINDYRLVASSLVRQKYVVS